MSMRETTLAPGQLLRSVHMQKSYLGKAGYPVLYNGYPPHKAALGQRKTRVNSYRHQTVHRGKVDPGVSELPQGNELSRDHVNRLLGAEDFFLVILINLKCTLALSDYLVLSQFSTEILIQLYVSTSKIK